MDFFYTSLFVFRFNAPVNNFSHVGTDPSVLTSTLGMFMCLAQEHNTVPPVGIEPGSIDSDRVRCSTTTSPCSLRFYFYANIYKNWLQVFG